SPVQDYSSQPDFGGAATSTLTYFHSSSALSNAGWWWVSLYLGSSFGSLWLGDMRLSSSQRVNFPNRISLVERIPRLVRVFAEAESVLRRYPTDAVIKSSSHRD
ncbi:hypothetical protein M5D96_013868, partial [Drosophila gunungcola]